MLGYVLRNDIYIYRQCMLFISRFQRILPHALRNDLIRGEKPFRKVGRRILEELTACSSVVQSSCFCDVRC